MDKRKIIRTSCILFCLVALAGCETLKSRGAIGTKTGTELAVEAILPEMLQDCEGMPPDPGNSVGELLSDGTTAMTLLSECMVRHGRLVQYLRPVVEAERKRIPQ